MKGINFITNEKGEKIAFQIDLKSKEEPNLEYLEE